jgi:hypothetical protein
VVSERPRTASGVSSDSKGRHKFRIDVQGNVTMTRQCPACESNRVKSISKDLIECSECGFVFEPENGRGGDGDELTIAGENETFTFSNGKLRGSDGEQLIEMDEMSIFPPIGRRNGRDLGH